MVVGVRTWLPAVLGVCTALATDTLLPGTGTSSSDGGVDSPTRTGPTRIPASSPLVRWSGRTLVDDEDGSVHFDWIGVSSTIAVVNSTYVTVTVTSNATVVGTRFKSYTSDQGFLLYPMATFLVSPVVSDTHLLFAIDNASNGNRTITMENLIDAPGVTSVHSFQTDGSFIAPAPALPGRNIEFIGDSITAATNMVRPEGAPACADHDSFQSDYSQTYQALLCHRFGASCSTIAVGGKCMMEECPGLQMPDYYNSRMRQDGGLATWDFHNSAWKPDAVFINLGTNDMRVIHGWPEGVSSFINQTVAFLHTVVARYGKPDIRFFLGAGPIRNITWMETAAANANAEGLDATFVDQRTACTSARIHEPDDTDQCDGCSNHPGLEGHRRMYDLAYPVIAAKMGWK